MAGPYGDVCLSAMVDPTTRMDLNMANKMANKMVIAKTDGCAFEDDLNSGRVIVFGHETNGQYSLMEYSVAPGTTSTPVRDLDCYPHCHGKFEETFLVQSGSLQFLLGDDVLALTEGDFVRVPKGVRHGFVNTSGEQVDLLVGFQPGGFEELFVKYRSNQTPAPSSRGFIDDAVTLFDSEFERY